MTRLVTFDCPSCSAPIKTPESATVVHCDYCGNNLMVPDNLRSSPDRFGHTIVINTGSEPHTYSGPEGKQPLLATVTPSGKRVRANRGCVLLFLIVIILLVVVPIAAAAWGVMSFSNLPFLIEIMNDDFASSDFASKELSFGGKGRGPGLFDYPVDLTASKDGDIYVLEGTTGRVQRFDRNGKYLNAWVVEGGSNFNAISADPETGEIYIVSNPKIYKYNGLSGEPIGEPIEKGSAFFATYDLDVFSNGDLLTFVSGDDSDALVRRTPEGQEVGRYAKVVSKIYGEKAVAPAPWTVRLAVDKSERMLVLNKGAADGAEVLIYGPDGEYERRFGGEGSGFSFANDVTVDNKGRIYVSTLHGVTAFDSLGKNLGTIRIPFGTIAAIEATGDDEILMLSQTQEVLKYKIR